MLLLLTVPPALVANDAVVAADVVAVWHYTFVDGHVVANVVAIAVAATRFAKTTSATTTNSPL